MQLTLSAAFFYLTPIQAKKKILFQSIQNYLACVVSSQVKKDYFLTLVKFRLF